ncbi:MAG: SAMP-activating enzyme [Candidatus Methanomethylophilaceae archaeon]|nr:SAMP-activating enzyme [Candidatus Methanomethylophilaceae archaeon]MDI3542074.1 SAMP-activating enzyme [Candidatus Methanomethylophilaceae archaeon]
MPLGNRECEEDWLKKIRTRQLRYSRQIPLAMMGDGGQQTLLESKALIVGLGGLGSIVGSYLAAAGVGHLTVVDDDVVEVSNLNRQFIYGDALGRLKAEAAADFFRRVNPQISVEPVSRSIQDVDLPWDMFDVAFDCLDNNESRMVLNERCYEAGVPLVHAGVDAMQGQVFTSIPNVTACLRCILPKGRQDRIPVFGPAAGAVASIQVSEGIRVLLERFPPLTGKMLLIDLSDYSFQTFEVRRAEDCPVCHH